MATGQDKALPLPDSAWPDIAGDLFQIRRRAAQIILSRDGHDRQRNPRQIRPQIRRRQSRAAAEIALAGGGGKAGQDIIDQRGRLSGESGGEPTFGRGRAQPHQAVFRQPKTGQPAN